VGHDSLTIAEATARTFSLGDGARLRWQGEPYRDGNTVSALAIAQTLLAAI
jgi:hypothetical protein